MGPDGWWTSPSIEGRLCTKTSTSGHLVDKSRDRSALARLSSESVAVATRSPPTALQGDVLTKVIAIANQKGGVGKTTASINLGGALAELGYRVLCIDMDPQANLTVGLGISLSDVRHSMADVLSEDRVPLDVIIIDCPPTLGLLTINSLVASSRVIIPVQTQYYAIKGLTALIKVINTIKLKLNHDLEIL